MTETELFKILDPNHYTLVHKWLDRGDGVAVYENKDLGHRKFVSFGSPAAQLEFGTPPKRLPDIGRDINWRYQLEAAVRRTP